MRYGFLSFAQGYKNEDKEVTCVDLFEINLEDIEELENMELASQAAGSGFGCDCG